MRLEVIEYGFKSLQRAPRQQWIMRNANISTPEAKILGGQWNVVLVGCTGGSELSNGQERDRSAKKSNRISMRKTMNIDGFTLVLSGFCNGFAVVLASF